MKAPPVKPVRCAIYTRVSTDHGLDQEFNSLNAQHDAASAYIKSQAHAGWTLIRSRYDDGGYSGGSTDRPDLQRLLEDIRARKIIPLGVSRNEVRPTRIERRARLVNAIARGRRWLDEIVSGSVTDIKQIATRQKCSARQVNMTISLAFLAPNLVRAEVEGRLPRGIGVERLRDTPAEWSLQFETLGLNPQ